jgi:adenylosuccinate synthase
MSQGRVCGWNGGAGVGCVTLGGCPKLCAQPGPVPSMLPRKRSLMASSLQALPGNAAGSAGSGNADPATAGLSSTPGGPEGAAAGGARVSGWEADLLQRAQLTSGHTAVVGLQYGDEGKGQIVDALAGTFDVVARYNGGANAGHSVQVGEEKIALHLIPSGILSPRTLNVLGNGVVIDPAQLLKEIDGLRERGVTIGENLAISDRAHVVLPYHKAEDVLFDQALATAWEGQAAIGTTGRGIGPCYADKATRSTAIRMGDLARPQELRQKLSRSVAVKNVVLKALAGACGKPFDPFDPETLLSDLLTQAERLRPHIRDTTQLLQRVSAEGGRVLFEGANATLLDIDHGTYPFVTSSNCSALGIHAGAGVPGRSLQQVIGVFKLYTSRVGGGPFTTEIHDELGQRIREAGREYGTTTGRPRRCGWLDLVAVKYAVELSGVTAIACTGLSVLSGLPKLRVCVGYRYAGEALAAFPPDASILAEVEPVYEDLPGFEGDTGSCRSFGELPEAARAYVERVESHVGARIAMVCVGRRRDQILVR